MPDFLEDVEVCPACGKVLWKGQACPRCSQRTPVNASSQAHVERLADVVQSSGRGASFCRWQPENREAWGPVGDELEARGAT